MTAVSLLSEKGQAPTVASETRQYLTFSLAGEMFAVGTLSVKEIIEYGQVTTVPMVPSFIRGVINLRGAVVPVIDLGVRFRNEPTEITRRSCIVILEVPSDDGTQTLSIVVDAVNEVLEISPADIEPPPAFGAKIRTDFIDGMGKVAGKFVILINVGKVLSVEEISSLANVARTTE
ncbi:MAG TPA: chemotaxis protein CheW [Rhodocyclaceae bacterium]|nr:chemotaxis protein CheW [Rhodocyclaceae bacterium]